MWGRDACWLPGPLLEEISAIAEGLPLDTEDWALQ